jgi:hypothetical protein
MERLSQKRAHFRFVHCAKGRRPAKYELIRNTKTTKGLGPDHPANTSRVRSFR